MLQLTHFALIFALFFVSNALGASCTVNGNIGACPNGTFDMTALNHGAAFWTQSVNLAGTNYYIAIQTTGFPALWTQSINGVTYTLNTTLPGGGTDKILQIPVTQTAPAKTSYGLGSVVSGMSQNGNVLTSNYNIGQGARQGTLVITCGISPTPSNFTVTEITGQPYIINFQSSFACPSSPPPPPPPPGIINCTVTTPTSALCENVTYDISEAVLATSPTLSFELDNDLLFLFQVASAGLPRVVPVGASACILPEEGYVAAIFNLMNGNCDPIALLSDTEKWALFQDSFPQLLSVHFPESPNNSTLTSIFQCGSSQFASILTVDEEAHGNFMVLVSHCSACDTGCA